MYDQMTREELIAQLHEADEEILRLKGENERLALDYADATHDVDYWQGMYQELENKTASEEYRQRRAEQRRMVEWNEWARNINA